jgi:hypothetical protein
MARVFLSHSTRDTAAAAELKAWLEGQGFAPAFLDFDKHSGIPAGADWERTLYEQIQRCQVLVILQTPNWSASRWCFAEFTQARALGKPIFQVVESDEAAAEEPIAADLQRLDLRHDRPAGLEQLRRELERFALQDQGGFPWPPPSDPNRSPFPGLMVFEAEDAPVFFGRDNDWRTVIERLRTQRLHGGTRLLVIQGSSRSGKSSLLRAGVLPRLRRAGREWLVLPVLRPQARPLESLAQSLAVGLQRPEAWRELHQQMLTTAGAPALAGLVTGWAADLRLAAGTPEAQVLLPIDQAEELFTVAEAVERQRFVAVLAAALHQPVPLQAVMTIRADGMASLQALPELVNSLDVLPLVPLSPHRYREIIEGPARLHGLILEPEFVERAIQDTATEDVLPLLAFVLRELHNCYGGVGVLSLSNYMALGDPAADLSPIANALKVATDSALYARGLNNEFINALLPAFLQMCRIDEDGIIRKRVAKWEEIPIFDRGYLGLLVEAGILVASEGGIEVAYELLFQSWPPLRFWISERWDFLKWKRRVEQDAKDWLSSQPEEKQELLLSGLKLERAQMWLRSNNDLIQGEIKEFIEASINNAENSGNALVRLAGSFGLAGIVREHHVQKAKYEEMK